jgi:hypothetical protein
MKKIILFILFFLSVTLHFGGNGLSISTSQELKAQQQYGCWNPNSGSGFFSWLGNALSNVGQAIANVANAIGSFFSGGDDGDGGEGFGDETGSDGWFEPSGPPDNFFNPMDDPWFQPPGFGQDEWDIMNNLNYWYGVYSNGGNPPVQDCNGVWAGSAYTGSCGVCMGGSTGITTCMADSLRTDTVKPIKIPCDTAAIKRDTLATKMLDSLDKRPDMKKLRDSVHANHEAALSAYDSSGFTTVMPGTYNNGDSNSVSIIPCDTTTGPNHKTITAIVHTHQTGIDPIPDCHDLFQFLHTRLLLVNNIYYNPFITHSFIICGDTTIDLAITIADTVSARTFINIYAYSSCVKLDSSGRNPEWADYKSSTFGDTISMRDEFNKAYDLLRKNNYPDQLLNTYAQVYMIERYNMGIKTLMKVDGIMKELSPIITRDPVTGELKNLKINICQ